MPLIPEAIIEQIAAANDIVEVIGSYFPLKRAGPLYKALCPFHQERTPSFSVNPQKQIFKCFGCGAGGSVFRFVMDYEKIDFITAVRKLAEKANIRIPEAEMSADDFQRADMRRRLLALHGEAADFFHACLMRTPAGEPAREYFKKRGLGADVAKSWKLGYSHDSWDALLSHLQQGGYTGEELEASGLFSRNEDSARFYDRFRGRVMFPICNDTGEVIAFSGRVLNAEQSPAKYVNSPETLLFTKGAVLFGLNKSKRALIEKKQAIVCEGQIDLITAFENGVQNVIAPQGTAFTERQARILKRFVEEVVLCFDADAAGEKAAERSLPHLLGAGLLVRCAEMPPGEDPDSLIRSRGGPAFAEVIAQSQDFFDFQIGRLKAAPEYRTSAGHARAAERIAGFVAMIKEGFRREAVLNSVCSKIDFTKDRFDKLVRESGATTGKPTQLPESLRTVTERTAGALALGFAARKLPLPTDRNDEDAVLDAPRTEPVKLSKAMEMLCFAAMFDQASRCWLQARDSSLLESDDSLGAVLLKLILRADITPDVPANVTAFISKLSPEQSAAISSLTSMTINECGELVPARERRIWKHNPASPILTLIQDSWINLAREALLQARQNVEARLRAPSLSFEEQAQFHQQIIDLHRQLGALPPPRPPKSDT